MQAIRAKIRDYQQCIIHSKLKIDLTAIYYCDDPKDVRFETCNNDIVAMMPIMMKVMVTLFTIWDKSH